jgi:hypothetical protein
MPQLVTVRVTRPERRPIRIWVPVLPVLLLCSPIVVLAALGAAVACLIYHIDVMRALGAGWRVVCALPGTRLDIEDDDMGFLISIR